MITLSEVKRVLDQLNGEQFEEDAGALARTLLTKIVEREEALTDTCPVCQGTGGYWTDEWQEDKYCSGLGVVTAARGYGA